jgi:hypothetical protein
MGCRSSFVSLSSLLHINMYWEYQLSNWRSFPKCWETIILFKESYLHGSIICDFVSLPLIMQKFTHHLSSHSAFAVTLRIEPSQVARCTLIINPGTDDSKYVINVKQIAKVIVLAINSWMSRRALTHQWIPQNGVSLVLLSKFKW